MDVAGQDVGYVTTRVGLCLGIIHVEGDAHMKSAITLFIQGIIRFTVPTNAPTPMLEGKLANHRLAENRLRRAGFLFFNKGKNYS